MAATSWRKNIMDQLVNKLSKSLPGVSFVAGSSFYWSPKNLQIHYINDDDENNIWALLHEASHAILDHTSYNSDFELLHLEVAAWEEAKDLAKKFKIKIDEEHIQDCLDTYRDWLHQRSTCPTCSTVSFQSSVNEYRCHNCYTTWRVSNSRFCRPYRLRNGKTKEKSSEENPQTTFA